MHACSHVRVQLKDCLLTDPCIKSLSWGQRPLESIVEKVAGIVDLDYADGWCMGGESYSALQSLHPDMDLQLFCLDCALGALRQIVSAQAILL